MSLAKARKLKGHQTKTTRWVPASDEELKLFGIQLRFQRVGGQR